jgi:hypothetical protein
VNPALIGHTVLIWETCLFALAVAMALWFTVCLRDNPTPLRCLGFGVYLGALALLNPALTTAYPVCVVWALTGRGAWSWRFVARGAGLATLGWLVAVAPWTVRNYVHFRELIYVRGGLQLELWLGVCPEADEDVTRVYRCNFPRDNVEQQRHLRTLGERAYLAECGNKARRAIRDDPARWLHHAGLRAVDFWLGTVFSRGGPAGSGADPAPLKVLVILGGQILVVLVLLLLFRRLDGGVGWMLAILLAYSAIYCLTHYSIRYRTPIEPVTAVLVGVSCATAIRFHRQRSAV